MIKKWTESTFIFSWISSKSCLKYDYSEKLIVFQDKKNKVKFQTDLALKLSRQKSYFWSDWLRLYLSWNLLVDLILKYGCWILECVRYNTITNWLICCRRTRHFVINHELFRPLQQPESRKEVDCLHNRKERQGEHSLEDSQLEPQYT